jgi:CheY-like chemotaxis protein
MPKKMKRWKWLLGYERFSSGSKARLHQTEQPNGLPTSFEIDSAFQGQEGLDLIEKSLQENHPYAMAFVDVRMPPGWDGVETTAKSGKNIPTCRWSSARPIRIIRGRTC